MCSGAPVQVTPLVYHLRLNNCTEQAQLFLRTRIVITQCSGKKFRDWAAYVQKYAYITACKGEAAYDGQ